MNKKKNTAKLLLYTKIKIFLYFFNSFFSSKKWAFSEKFFLFCFWEKYLNC